jgi:hypothetical protein
MTYAQAFGRALLLVGLSISINAHLEARTAPLTPSQLQAKGKADAMEKACKRLKKEKRKKYDRLCKG